MTSAIETLQQSANVTLEKFQAVKREIQSNQQARQQLLQQKNENTMVLEELNLLPDDANVYKLIGPALIKQDPVEAKANVRKRLEFIEGELARSEHQYKSMEAKMNEHQQEIVKLQKKIQTLSSKKSKSGN